MAKVKEAAQKTGELKLLFTKLNKEGKDKAILILKSLEFAQSVTISKEETSAFNGNND